LIGDVGERHCLVLDFAATLFAAGSPARLRQLWQWI
jgi:hypothetical protein